MDILQIWQRFRTEHLWFFALVGSSLFFRRLQYVYAAPVPDSSDTPVPQPSSSSTSTFQVLAEGTQDLAALVGLFATDSVERYAIDYSRGYLSVAMAHCSVLGILGYVRAMVKIAMGTAACEKAAFPTAPVRTILGVAKSDMLPGESVVEVTYIKRNLLNNPPRVQYEKVKTILQTESTFPPAEFVAGQHGTHEFPDLWFLELRATGIRTANKQKFRDNPLILSRMWGSVIITAALTSFPILLIAPQQMSWSKIVGSFGLFIALSICSIMWSSVYISEQLPNMCLLGEDGTSELFSEEPESLGIVTCPRGGTMRLIGDLRTVPGWVQLGYELTTYAMSAVIVLGYLCQYIEVRKATTFQAGIWLGVQAGLAMVRILVWVIDPVFDDYTSFSALQPMVKQFQTLHAVELCSLYFPGTTFQIDYYGEIARLSFPTSVLQRLKETQVETLLTQAVRTVNGKHAPTVGCNDSVGPLPEDIIAKITESCATWIFPEELFLKWLVSRAGEGRDKLFSPKLWPNRHSAVLVNVDGDTNQPWEKGEIWLVLVFASSLDYSRNPDQKLYTVISQYATVDEAVIFDESPSTGEGRFMKFQDVKVKDQDEVDNFREAIGRHVVDDCMGASAYIHQLQATMKKMNDALVAEAEALSGRIRHNSRLMDRFLSKNRKSS